MFFYSLFHLTVSSDVELDAFQTIDEPNHIDIYIRLGKVSAEDITVLQDAEVYDHYKYNETVCFFELPEDGSRFLVAKKSAHTDVTIQINDPQYLQTVLSYFYGTGLSSILHYNGHFPVHASGVGVDDRLILFCGRSGIGKSTLAAQLKTRGYHLFSDDKCLLLPRSGGGWIAKPGLRIMRLWQDAIDTIDPTPFLSNPKEVVLRKDKYQFEINSDDLISRDQRLSSVYIIQQTKEDDISYHELSGVIKLKKFRHQIFRLKMIKGMRLDMQLWEFITKLLEDIPVYLVMRPKDMTSDEFASHMDQHIREELVN